MSLNQMATVLMYVNPETTDVEKVIFYSVFGTSERIDGDWVPTTREESGIDDLSADRVYKLDWDTDFIPMDSEDGDREHAAIALYDQGQLDEEGAKKYGTIHIDPEEPEDLDLEKFIGQ